MLDLLIKGSDFEKGLFVTLVGILGVFLVLILFYLVIRVFTRFFPYKSEESSETK
ncbi:MAG: OadG family protein [Clostridiaceae bacterium]|jgi:Na+-transporting methylmalonyl-CoA/oxaloacetate decarboxylase gamma subunit|nr:OadG family protein [Clostridiaceae bacterium]